MYKKIIVPLDGSELAECVLPHVEVIGQGYGMPEVTFLYVIRPSGNWENWTNIHDEREKATDYLEKKVQSARDKAINAKFEILVGNPGEGVTDYGSHPAGDPASAITFYAAKERADLIIMATHGRSGISRWAHGSIADRVLRSSGVPVLMVRAPGCGLQAQYKK
jgi:nucleotide-binding universal stress UspA family protein